jgi:hypothetical protein
VRLDQVEYGIGLVLFAFVIKVDPRMQADVDPAREDDGANVRRLWAGVPARYDAGFDRLEPPQAGLEVGYCPAETGETGVNRLILAIVGAGVLTLSVGLPDFDLRVAHDSAIPVIDIAL